MTRPAPGDGTTPGSSDRLLWVRWDVGSGPVIVLLHGINADADQWRGVIDALGAGYRVIAPDLLGFGKSPKPEDAAYTADDHAEALEATLAHLGVTERFVLVGYSMGGSIAVRFAARYPDRLRRLFLLAAPFYLPPEAYGRREFGWQYAQARFYQWLWRVVASQKERDTRAYGVLTGPLEAPVAAFMRTQDLEEHWDIMAKNLAHTISATSLIDDLPRLTMPTTFAVGVLDAIVRPDQTVALQRLKPDLEVRRIVGIHADHMLPEKAPRLVAGEILADEAPALAVRYHEGSGIPVVLLAGLTDGRPWIPAAEELSSRREVVVLDPLGFGRSARPLASHYTLEDHAAAVDRTLVRLFGQTPVTLVGQGLGAAVALAAAASLPDHVRDVVAFSPALVDPRTAGHDQVSDPVLAQLLATRDTYAAWARDERNSRLETSAREAEIIPVLRSIDTVLNTPADDLIARQVRPVRLVLPRSDTQVATGWLREVADAEPQRFQLMEVDGGPEYPYRWPRSAVAIVEGELLPSPPETERPRAGTVAPLARRLGRTLHSQLIRHGLWALVVGLALLLLPVVIPSRVVAWTFAGWLVVEAAGAIVGAVGLRRSRYAWVGRLIVGAAGVGVAALAVAGAVGALSLLGSILGAGLVVRGAASLFAALRAPRTPGNRATFIVEGILGILVGIALLTVPALGGSMVRWVLGLYLTATGVATLASAYAAHRSTVRRALRYVGEVTAGATGTGA